MKKIILLSALLTYGMCNACTGIAVLTKSGTIVGQNLDYYYYFPQKFELMLPIQQFNNWYENNYKHNNKFYALVSENNVQMGVNEHGLAVFEENSPKPKDAKEQRRFQQPENGNSEGMVKYGILQNFNTIDEILPLLSKIFSMAQPDFYQIADDKKILTVEVATAKNNIDPIRQFTYKIINKPGAYSVHTNYYLHPEYASFNNFKDADYLCITKNRYAKITGLIANSQTRDIDAASDWLKNTQPNITTCSNNNTWQDTSVFRSNLQGFKQVIVGNTENKQIYGTVSSLLINNNGSPDKSYVYAMMLDSITTNNLGQQLIKYRELHTTIKKLFTSEKLVFTNHELIRMPQK